MTSANRIVVIGASAGGVEALLTMLPHLDPDLPAAVCVVVHQPASASHALTLLVDRASPLPATTAQDGQVLQPGHVYVAHAGVHLLVEGSRLHLVAGPVEHGFRPAIDPLFRTAGASFGPAAVGVVLSGSLDDGKAGAVAIRDAGGRVVVQEPADAIYADMPANAIQAVGREHVAGILPIAEIAPRVATLVEAVGDVPPPRTPERPDPAARASAFDPRDREFPEGLSCPVCSGPLHVPEKDEGGVVLLCQVGHGWSLESLATGQRASVETALWTAVRVLEERAALSRRLLERARERQQWRAATRYRREIGEAEEQAQVLREIITATVPSPSTDETQDPELAEPDVQNGPEVSRRIEA